MITMNLSEAKNKLRQVVRRISETTDRVVITVSGRNQAVLISMEEYESLQETIEILKDQTVVRKIMSSMTDIKNGNTVNFEDIRKDAYK